jgi:hypothetical protein
MISRARGRVCVWERRAAPQVHDTYYPGWLAEVDGRPASIQRAFVLFRGVEVPAGTHRVTFRFAPFSFTNLRDAVNAAHALSVSRP